MSITSQFQSTLPVWGGTFPVDPHAAKRAAFQSTLPVWGGTLYRQGSDDPGEISIHPPRVGRDQPLRALRAFVAPFQSTLPVWGGTLTLTISYWISSRFQSTLPVWGGTLCRSPCQSAAQNFNPPSPCGEGLFNLIVQLFNLFDFNPPSPCGEGRKTAFDQVPKALFQSTLPVWGGTRSAFIRYPLRP